MNPTQPLLIEIVSDVVCPWCFIGLRRLDLAIDAVRRKHPDFACVKQWRPFFLNPDTPPEGALDDSFARAALKGAGIQAPLGQIQAVDASAGPKD